MIAADNIGFPIVVRPSYVLGGRAMQLVHNNNELEVIPYRSCRSLK